MSVQNFLFCTSLTRQTIWYCYYIAEMNYHKICLVQNFQVWFLNPHPHWKREKGRRKAGQSRTGQERGKRKKGKNVDREKRREEERTNLYCLRRKRMSALRIRFFRETSGNHNCCPRSVQKNRPRENKIHKRNSDVSKVVESKNGFLLNHKWYYCGIK